MVQVATLPPTSGLTASEDVQSKEVVNHVSSLERGVAERRRICSTSILSGVLGDQWWFQSAQLSTVATAEEVDEVACVCAKAKGKISVEDVDRRGVYEV